MSDLLTHIARLEMVDVDLDKEPACEGRDHPAGLSGHDGGPAKYRLVCPECKTMILQCAGRIQDLRATERMLCVPCGRILPTTMFGFIEL